MRNHCLQYSSFVRYITHGSSFEDDGNQFTYLNHLYLTNKLVTALIGSAGTLELYIIILLILMIVYVVCDYTIPNKASVMTYLLVTLGRHESPSQSNICNNTALAQKTNRVKSQASAYIRCSQTGTLHPSHNNLQPRSRTMLCKCRKSHDCFFLMF